MAHMCKWENDCYHGKNHKEDRNCYMNTQCPDCKDIVKMRKEKLDKLNGKCILEDN